MSGHSKWSTIKRKKGALDAKRGQIFSKLVKEITVAARMSGGDIEGNPRLRQAVLKARTSSMPNDNIERAIKKGTGDLEGTTYDEITYEGYGPGGVALMIEVLTDNRNRTLSDVRFILTRHGGNLGENGCVGWLFEKKGIIQLDKGSVIEDKLMEAALEAGAEDMTEEGDVFEVKTAPNDLETVRQGLEKAGFKPTQAEVSAVPQTYVKLTGKQANQMLKIMDLLDDQDDVQNVWANFDISEEEMEAMD